MFLLDNFNSFLVSFTQLRGSNKKKPKKENLNEANKDLLRGEFNQA